MKVKNREWVKNAAIVLLAALLVLTFFSNTIMNRNLPEVATQYVSDGTINAKVRGTGTVTANGNNVVKAEETREIRAVMVKAGQTVEVGDVLFVLGSGDKSELEQAQEQLQQLQLSYQRTALGGSYTDYTADELRVAAAWEDYVQAEAALDAMDPMGNTDSDAYRYLQKQLDKATAERDAAKEAYDSTLAEAQGNLSSAESERLSAEQAVLLVEGWNPNDPDPEQQALQQKYLNDPQLRIDELLSESSQPAEEGGEPAAPDGDREQKLAKWQALLEKKNAVDAAEAALNAVSTDRLDAAQSQVDELQEEMSVFNTSPEYKEAAAAKNTAYLTYLDLKNTLDARKNADAKSSASIGLDLSDLSRQIEEQKKKIEELSGGEGNQVLAKVSGTVQSVECTAGDTVLKDNPLCVIEVPDMGYSMAVSVTSDQASRLHVGDSATISNYYWGREITATLSTIRVDPKDPQNKKLLTFDISGDVSAGAELTVSIGQRSANYDWVVPKSALHSDSGGSFIYKVESKNSPLGNRYIARRVNVEILAQDDTSVAVTGDLGWGDYVITTSSAPVKNGDMVRLADN
ncbi:MAG: HlyD family efflux transporter periplasmic adaptor subunit [Oscillospiraceae bacterium]|nr:HlyD family efflux transporter periplasmic adaptor subunit [Oscillospiraceae bacterium]